MTERSWHRTFDDPIPLPDGGELIGVLSVGKLAA